jgi:thiamine biosynthesis lipoprotein
MYHALARLLCGLPLLVAVLLLTSCGGDNKTHRQTFPALGTLITIEIHDPDARRAERATRAVAEYLERIGREWYAWGDGELGRVNAALAQGEAAPVSPELAAPIRRALEIRDLSAGYFDPAVGLLVEAWGFHATNGPPVTPPTDSWLTRWRTEGPERARLHIDANLVAAPVPLKLALGGLAKGTALAASMEVLAEYGIDNALVDAGGDVQVIGHKGERDWRIGIRDPRGPGVLGAVALRPGEAILSSGDYERFFELDGKRFHHLLDPHTGLPVAHTAGVTVIHGDAELADAAATALMAAGPERFLELAARLDVRLALLVTTEGEILTTQGMQARLDGPGVQHNAPTEL